MKKPLPGLPSAPDALRIALDGLTSMFERLSPSQLREAMEGFEAAPGLNKLPQLQASVFRLADLWWALASHRTVVRGGRRLRFSCRGKGCNGCCIDKVEASPAEARVIARRLIPIHKARVMAQTDGSCPLLVDGRCVVYSVRPLVCRTWNTVDDPAGCGTPGQSQHRIRDTVVEALMVATYSEGLGDLVTMLRAEIEGSGAASVAVGLDEAARQDLARILTALPPSSEEVVCKG